MPSKKIIRRKDNPDDVEMYKKGGEIWEKKRPESLGKPKKLQIGRAHV